MSQGKLWCVVLCALLLFGCKENSVPAGSTAQGTDPAPAAGSGGTTSGSGAGGSGTDTSGGGAPPPPPPADSAPPADPPLSLPQPAQLEVDYAGPNDDELRFSAAVQQQVGDKVQEPDRIWHDCIAVRYDGRPKKCTQYALQEKWKHIGHAVDRLDAEQFGNANVFQAWSEQDYKDQGIHYGSLTLDSRIGDLPATHQRAQVSRLYTAITQWSGYPDYLVVSAGLPNGNLELPPSASMNTATLVRIYGEEGAQFRDKSGGKPLLLAEKRFTGEGRYDFELPWDSPYWQMQPPVQFTVVISQWLTVTNRP